MRPPPDGYIENDVSAATEAVEVLRQQLASGYLGDDTPDWAWSAVQRIMDRDEKRAADRAISPQDAAAVFELALHAAAIESNRSDEDRWSTLLDIADACPSYATLPMRPLAMAK
jgi:hypothetical protein